MALPYNFTFLVVLKLLQLQEIPLVIFSCGMLGCHHGVAVEMMGRTVVADRVREFTYRLGSFWERFESRFTDCTLFTLSFLLL